MDLSQSALISQFEDDSSLTEQQIDDVTPLERDPQNGMLGLLIFI
jgi:hypothetical protein